MLQKFGLMETMPAFDADVKAGALPLTSDDIDKNSEILAKFGALSSGKGASTRGVKTDSKLLL